MTGEATVASTIINQMAAHFKAEAAKWEPAPMPTSIRKPRPVAQLLDPCMARPFNLMGRKR